MTSPSPKKRNRGYYKAQAEAIYTLEMREAIIRMTHLGLSDQEIASELGQSVGTIRRYREKTLSRLSLPDPNGPPPLTTDDEPEIPKKAPPKGPGPGPHRPRSPKHAIEVLPAPDVVLLRRDCLARRKKLQPFDQMAEELGISEQEARRHVADALRSLSVSETTTAELERRLMVEQLDEMIRAIYDPATDPEHPVLEATDRVLKLLDRKAKLLGLDQVPTLDIMAQLQELAQEGNYDIRELEDIARDVLSRRRFKIQTLGQTSPSQDPSA